MPKLLWLYSPTHPSFISSAYPYYIPVLLGLEHFSALSSKVGLDEDHTYIYTYMYVYIIYIQYIYIVYIPRLDDHSCRSCHQSMKIGMTKNAPKTRIPVLWDDRPNDSPVYSQNVVDQFHFHIMHTKYGKTMGKTMGKPMKSLLNFYEIPY